MYLIQSRRNRSQSDTSSLGLTIAPTLDCNFRCVYCYEKDRYRNTQMSDSTIDSIVEYIKNYPHKLSKLSITWYGGEPLLAMSVIEKLSQKVLEIARERKIDYSAMIVTNGYLLSKRIAMQLKEYRIAHVQITIDGIEKKHDEKRPLIGGGKTYTRIMKNLSDIDGIFEGISVRVNCDKDNMDDFKDIYNEIAKYDFHKVFVYASPIKSEGGCHIESKCIPTFDFFDNEYRQISQLNENDFYNYIFRKYPVLRGNSCGADTVESMVIAADGNLYKCWSDIGNLKMCFGNINHVEDIRLDKASVYRQINPLENKKCKECKLLPICMGGCPYEVMHGKQCVCQYNEKYLEKYIQHIAYKIGCFKHGERKIVL